MLVSVSGIASSAASEIYSVAPIILSFNPASRTRSRFQYSTVGNKLSGLSLNTSLPTLKKSSILSPVSSKNCAVSPTANAAPSPTAVINS